MSRRESSAPLVRTVVLSAWVVKFCVQGSGLKVNFGFSSQNLLDPNKNGDDDSEGDLKFFPRSWLLLFSLVVLLMCVGGRGNGSFCIFGSVCSSSGYQQCQMSEK